MTTNKSVKCSICNDRIKEGYTYNNKFYCSDCVPKDAIKQKDINE